MNAANRAAGAGQFPDQAVFGKSLAADILSFFIVSRPEIPGRQAVHGIKRQDINRGSQAMIFIHEFGFYHPLVNLFINMPVSFFIGNIQRDFALNHDSLKIFAAEHRSQPKSSKMPVGIYIDPGKRNQLLTRPAYSDTAPQPGTGFAPAQNPARILRGQTPQRLSIPKLHPVFRDCEICGQIRLPFDNYGIIPCKTQGQTEPQTSIAFTQFSR